MKKLEKKNLFIEIKDNDLIVAVGEYDSELNFLISEKEIISSSGFNNGKVINLDKGVENLKKAVIPDLIMVPLVSFDNKLNRIGYGKGYYDRILKKINKVKKKAIFLGIAYSFQKCTNIPTNKYDFKLDYIFTERGIISSN